MVAVKETHVWTRTRKRDRQEKRNQTQSWNHLSGTKRIRIVSERTIDKEHLSQVRYFIEKLPTTMIIMEKPQEIIIHNLGVKDVPSKEILRGLFSKTLDLFKNVRENDSKEKKYNIYN